MLQMFKKDNAETFSQAIVVQSHSKKGQALGLHSEDNGLLTIRDIRSAKILLPNFTVISIS